MPEDWKAGLFKIAKKVDLSVCYNWRVITLLSLTSQFSMIMQERRLLSWRRSLVKRSKEQATDFCKGRSCRQKDAVP